MLRFSRPFPAGTQDNLAFAKQYIVPVRTISYERINNNPKRADAKADY
jgi:hypothetical protein